MSSALQQLEEQFIASWNHEALYVATESRTLSYGELYCLAYSLGTKLGWHGLSPGTRVSLCSENKLQLVAFYLAALIFDVSVIPVNPAFTPIQKDIILRIAQPKHTYDTANSTLPDSQPLTKPKSPLFQAKADSIPFLFFTSGTTGTPKGVAHYVESLLANAASFNQHMGITSTQRLLHVMPTSYMAGCLNTLLCPWMAGASVVLAPDFSVESALNLWRYAEQGKANTAWLTPTMVAMLTRLTKKSAVIDWVKTSFHYVMVGTAPLNKSTKQDFEAKFDVPCLESYGMSELLLVSAQQPTLPNQTYSVGKPLSGIQLTFAPDTQEMQINSPYLLAGYITETSSKLEPASLDGWFGTGDIAELSAEGELLITGRLKDLIIRGGRNISPRAIEEALLNHPEILDAAVLGLPHPFWGEEVVACLQATANYEEDALKAYLANRLDSEQLPTRFHVFGELPRNTTGKILKAQLRERLCSLV